MKKNSGLTNLSSFNKQFDTKDKKPGFNKNYGSQARIAAMQNIQRASGRRGN